MQVSEILRKLADLVDQAETVSAEEPAMQPDADGEVDITVAHLEPVEVDGTDNSEPETMVSPLQQEHELLKKSQGVPNNVEEFADSNANIEAEIEEMRGHDPDGEWGDDLHNDNDEDDFYQRKDNSNKGYESEKEEKVDELAQWKRIAGIGQTQKPHNYAEDIKSSSLNPRAEAAKEFHRQRNNTK